MPWHPTVWPMVKGVNPWSSSRAVASLYSAHICRWVCWRYARRLVTTSPRQAIAGQVCCGSHAIPPTPLGRLDSPNANPPIPPGRKRARLSAALDGAGHVLCRVAVAKAALLLDPLRSYVPVKVAAPDASKSQVREPVPHQLMDRLQNQCW